MIMPGLCLAAALAASFERSLVVSLRMEPAAGERSAVVLVLRDPALAATARREGLRVVVDLATDAPGAVASPPLLAPVLEMSFERRGAGTTRLALQLAAPHEFDLVRTGNELHIVFAARPLPADDVEHLVPLLFPTQAISAERGHEPLLPSREPRLRLEPTVSTLYATGDASYEAGPQPVSDSYYEVGPRLAAVSGPARVTYEARLRGGSRYAAANAHPMHLVEARVEHRLASDTQLSARYQFLRGRNQIEEVDPGGEYFFGFERFRKDGTGADLHVPLGGATNLLLSGGWDRVRFDRKGAFLDSSSWNARGGVRREIGGQTSLALLYTRQETYDADDADVAGSHADTVDLTLSGELQPRLTVQLSAGVSRRLSPGAPPGARNQTDVVANAGLRREFSPSTALEVEYQRARALSAFERNPSYRTDAVDVRLRSPLPWRFALAASAGFRENDYPLPAETIAEPRRDRVYGWGLGLGRTLGSRIVAHAEYRWRRRRSNLDRFSSGGHGLVVQLDVSPLRKGSGQ